MSAKRTQRSADITTAKASAKAVPVRESKPKRGLENPRSLEGLSAVASCRSKPWRRLMAKEENSGEDRGMSFALDRSALETSSVLPSSFSLQTLSATAPGIVLFLNRVKPKTRQGKVFLVNASQVFEKGDPKNFIPDAGIQRIADVLIGWKEEDKLSRIVDQAELKKNDYNISPSRYIHTSDAETYRPISEIVAESEMIEKEAEATDKALREILKQLGVGA